ncbi:MAG: hypothetical protein ABGX29_05745 [Candidatus Poseidoniia archaeon]|jgi:hypothetical protein
MSVKILCGMALILENLMDAIVFISDALKSATPDTDECGIKTSES